MNAALQGETDGGVELRPLRRNVFALDMPVAPLTMRAMTQVELREISKTFRGANRDPVPAVQRLSLTVAAGELMTIVGPSGCGKTTTLRLIAGLETPDRGEILLGGQVVNGMPPKAREIAMVFQRHALLPHLTARQNLELGLRLRGVPAAERRQHAAKMAETLGLQACLDRRPAGLSAGECQRVALGRALLRQPKVLLLDEPFANLDAPLRRKWRRELLRLHQERGLTTLFVTHDQAEALAVGQRVAIMNRGRIEQLGTPATLRERPATPFVSEFLNPAVI